MPGETPTLSAFELLVQSLLGIVENVPDWIGDWISAITGNPLLMLCVLIPFVGIGIHYLKLLTTTR